MPLSLAPALQPGEAASSDGCSFAFMLGNLLRSAETAASAKSIGQRLEMNT